MNEQDFRDALRHTMTVEAPPPPMSDAPVLDAAHRDRGRRRAMLAGLGSAVAVVAIAVAVVVVGPSADEGVQVGGPAVQTTDTANQPPQTGSASPDTKDTETSWPNGQTDRTATAGPQFDRGVTLGTALAAVIPAGYESPDDLTGGDAASGTYPLKSNQAQYMDTINGNQVWGYDARAPLTKGNGVGELSVNVLTPGLGGTGQACDIARAIGVSEGSCTEVTVDGKKVGVIDSTVDGQRTQRAVYRVANGSAVTVGQSTNYSNAGLPALDALPMTGEQLAALAVDPRFDVG
jgi:hypothetical protein